ncbi:16107_t:CDS:2, partial [Racocetra fulgida]
LCDDIKEICGDSGSNISNENPDSNIDALNASEKIVEVVEDNEENSEQKFPPLVRVHSFYAIPKD